MAEQADKEDRSEAATPRRLQRAREEGNAPISPELATLFLLGGATTLLIMHTPADMLRLCSSLAHILAAAGTLDGPAAIGLALRQAGADMLRAVFLVFALAIAAAAAATLVQTGFLLNPGALLPDLARLSPRRGLTKVFGSANRVQAAKSLVKVAIIGGALWHLLRVRIDTLVQALLREPAELPHALLTLTTSIMITALTAQAVIATFDVLMTRLRHSASLRMSRAEIRDEARESDGNPQVKAKIRRLRAQRARRRMAQAVAQATVVITNPTHYAVALAYDRSRSAAPRVVAKGMDDMAARIRAIAEENRIPMVANPPLARALHRVELDSDIPPEHYQAVAELIAYVWRLQGRARRRAS